MSNLVRSAITSALQNYDTLANPRLSVTNLDQTELATGEGMRFNSQKIFANFDAATPIYTLFENPSDSEVVIALQDRKLKTDTAGLENFQILWDYDVSTATKIPIPIFNQNNAFRATMLSKVEISLLNTVSASPDNGNWILSGVATILDEGIEREADFIPTTGVGSNTSGDISPDLGFRLYYPGTGFLTKIVSSANDNRVLWGYDWIEIPLDYFKNN